jgi:1,4-dihydroxy-2-naphthoyl-CoA hydrolase
MAQSQPRELGRDGLAELIGIEYLQASAELVRVRAPVTDRVRQQYGIVHGGTYSAIAESICSAATALAVLSEGKLAMGQSNSATFLRPIADGHVHATARPLHRGRTTWIWDTEIRDDSDRLCAVVRVTIAVRPAEQVTGGRSGDPPLSRGSGS